MAEVIDQISQVAIIVLGVGASILIARKNKLGVLMAFLSEPFWFATSYINKQWGVFLISILYTGTWGYAVYKWFKDDKEKRQAEPPKTS